MYIMPQASQMRNHISNAGRSKRLYLLLRYLKGLFPPRLHLVDAGGEFSRGKEIVAAKCRSFSGTPVVA